jgi:outer membrane protein assembly factor BamB
MSRRVLARALAVTLASACALSQLACLQVQGPGEGYVPRFDDCGDGVIDEGEVCDGDALGGASCELLGFGAGALGCADDCNDYDRTACAAPASCGDDVRQAPEICDGVDLAGLSCESLGYASGSLSCLGNCGEIELTGCVPLQAQDAGSGPGDGAVADQGPPVDGSAQDRATSGDGAAADTVGPVDSAPLPDGAAQPDGASSDAGPPDAAAAVVRWTFGDRAVGHPAIGPSGRIYVLRGDWVNPLDSWSAPGADEVVAINPDGSQAWRFAETDIRFGGAPAVTADGTVYVVGSPGRLFALNPDGSKRWTFEARLQRGYGYDLADLSQPAFGPDGTIYLGAPKRSTATGAAPARFFALRPDGSERWSVELPDISSHPVVSAAGQPLAVFMGTPDTLHRLDPGSGASTWAFSAFWPPDDPAREINGLGPRLDLVPGGALNLIGYRYPDVTASDSSLVMMRVGNGAAALSWTTDELTDDVLAGPVYASDGRAFAPLCSASYAADEVRVISTTGVVSTHATLDGSEHAVADPALAADGSLYAVMQTNDSSSYGTYALYAVTPGGQIRWSLAVDYPPGGVTIGHDGTVYVPTATGLLAIQGTSPLAPGGWADAHGGLANLRSAAPPPAVLPDAGVDAGADAGGDAGPDAGVDAGVDAGTDAGGSVDSGPSSCSPACTGDDSCVNSACVDPNGCPDHSHLVSTYCECDEGYVVNAAATACEPDGAGPASCAGHCGGQSSDGTCYCTTDCTTYNDCCTDYQAQCG